MSVIRLALCCGLAVTAFLVADARAEMVVLESTQPQFKRGDHLPGDKIETSGFAAGGRVKVLVLETQTTREFVGPKMTSPMIGGMRGLPHKKP